MKFSFVSTVVRSRKLHLGEIGGLGQMSGFVLE